MDLHTVGWEVISHGGDGRFVVLVVEAEIEGFLIYEQN